MQLAPSAFLASAAACTNLITTILPSNSPAHQLNIPGVDEALSEWKKEHNLSPPSPSKASKQKTWNIPHVEETYTSLLQRVDTSSSRARLLAAATKESGSWLNAMPISAFGLHLDNESVCIAIGLRLGAQLSHPIPCQQCGQQVDELGRHGLSCLKSQGRFSRHAAINAIIKEKLMAAQIPSTLEPSGLNRSDGKRPVMG